MHTALFSNDTQGLQTDLDLDFYCNTWTLDVNVENTKIVVFGKSKWKENEMNRSLGHLCAHIG